MSAQTDRFAEPRVSSAGVWWNPTDYKSIDQTPYLAYLDKEEEKVRAMQHALETDRDDDYTAAAYNRTTFEDEKPVITADDI